MNGQLDTDKLRDLLEIQKDYEAGVARKAYHEALAGFKSEAPTLVKDREVRYTTDKGTTQYRHVSLGYALTEVNPVLSKHGLSLTFRTNQEGGNCVVTATLSHKFGHSETTSLMASPDSSGGKNGIQSIASTITYLKRHTAFALLGLEGMEDNDGSHSSFESGTPEQRQQAQQNVRGQQEKPPYPDEKFEANFDAWEKSILEGKKTADAIIKTVQSRFTLTEEQKLAINTVAA
jgi:hypothetical protein